MVINTSSNAPQTLMLTSASERYTLDAANLRGGTVRLNGRTLELGVRDDLPRIAGLRTVAGALTFAPATITFLAIPAAANSACR